MTIQSKRAWPPGHNTILIALLICAKRKRPAVLYAAPLRCAAGLRQQGIFLFFGLGGMSKLMP